MMGIKSIVYEKNNQYFVIEIDEECEFSYRGLLVKIDNMLVFEYLQELLKIIIDWKTEYINKDIVGTNNWNLTINLVNGNKRVYCGYSLFPHNFKNFEKLNQKIISQII